MEVSELCQDRGCLVIVRIIDGSIDGLTRTHQPSYQQVLNSKGYADPLRAYIRADRPFFGICLGMQTLFEGSEESQGVAVGG